MCKMPLKIAMSYFAFPAEAKDWIFVDLSII